MANIDSPPPLLRLPPNLRQAIYDAAGLMIDRFIDLTTTPGPSSDLYNHNRQFNSTLWASRPFGNPRVTQNLLLTCRCISDEVSALVFGTCAFFIHFRAASSLHVLRQLRPSSLQSLTYLIVHLNVASCDVGQACHTECSHRGCPDHDLPLVNSSPALKEWRTTWDNHIRPYLTSGRLQLHLVCDCGDYEAARQAVEPFLELEVSKPAPLLRHCSIRLSHRPDEKLQHLARRAVHAATTGECLVDNESPFRFMDLPEEVRFHILTYTDLVTPLSEAEWSWPEGYRFRCANRVLSGTRPAEILHGYSHQDSVAQYRRSLEGTDWHRYLDRHSECRDHHACQFRACSEDSCMDGGCFCHRYHAAVSSKYPCQCWAPPTPLFLVCKSMRQTAHEVFFKCNRMVVMPPGNTWEAVTTTPERLPIARFLTETIPRHALRHIRFLEIVFPPFGDDGPCDYLAAGSPSWLDWRSSLRAVKEDLNLSVLTVRLYFADYIPRDRDSISQYRRDMTGPHATAITNTYLSTIRPMIMELQGLKRVFAHLAWPFTWTDRWRAHVGRNYEEARALRRQQVMVMERNLEKFMMGIHKVEGKYFPRPDCVYDALAEGKETESKSQWVWAHETAGWTKGVVTW